MPFNKLPTLDDTMKWFLVKTISCTKSEWTSHLEYKFGLYISIHRLKTVDLFFDCSQKQALKKHISEIHEEGKKPFKCDICDQSSSQKGNLSKHTYSVHDS